MSGIEDVGLRPRKPEVARALVLISARILGILGAVLKAICGFPVVRPLSAPTTRDSDSAAAGASAVIRLLRCMDTGSQRVATAFHGCRSGTGSDRAPADARGSSFATAGGHAANTPTYHAEEQSIAAAPRAPNLRCSMRRADSSRRLPRPARRFGRADPNGPLRQQPAHWSGVLPAIGDPVSRTGAVVKRPPPNAWSPGPALS